ncbi:hypothetical protein E5329_19955 [Petralouisia muris]|uniref:Uncharacterized protein n=1 Tax=Petralouisia muris TaxID=3032872 RepID=A0AC61RSQ6_9FIRM|nr:hypothetical protein [Petralouisia muris]TGY91775.1 hypothetical protein E5329_19955 [Petralouisia muris]
MYCCKKIQVLGHEIHIALYDTGAGISILIEGGEKGHIGAVAIASAGKVTDSIVFPSHKEDVICEQWSERISAVYHGPVVVQAGVHYDHITPEQIEEILQGLTRELDILVKDLESEG